MERKNQEIEQARRALEEKAKELALTSKYKSEFLANMSHELRTPLNSILVLGQQLGDNPEGNLTAKQVEFARTIHGAGTDLLNLISDILDLSKIESGTVSVEAEEIFFGSVLEMVARPFRHEADNRKLTFEVNTDPHLTRSLVTDSKRLQQVLKNLLSNAFKFTEEGGVRLTVSPAKSGWSHDHPILGSAASVIAFEVSDTGIGIPAGETTHHLRGLPAGGCRDEPQVRRNRSGTGDQPRVGESAGWRNPVEQRAGSWQHVHALSASDLRGAVDGAVPDEAVPCAARTISQTDCVGGHRWNRFRTTATICTGRFRAADCRRRPALCPRAMRFVARQGLQGSRGQARE